MPVTASLSGHISAVGNLIYSWHCGMERRSGYKMIITHFELITIMALTFKLVSSPLKKK